MEAAHARPTTLYLIRHGATEANLARPYRLQGKEDWPLAAVGIQQSEATRQLLSEVPFQVCYTSPLGRAYQTAEIVTRPHGLTPKSLEALTECDVGEWEGLDWDTILARDPQAYERFHNNPGNHGYPGGESFADVYRRAAPAIEKLLDEHQGETLLVVAHHVVNRTYLAGLFGLPPEQARRVVLDNCGISMVTRTGQETIVRMLNSTFHLRGLSR
jgi:broad specificity phosphatase PhoE